MIGIVPTLAGLALFGPAAHVRGRLNAVARVTRGFAGVDGLMTKRSGSRGAAAEARGTLFTNTPLQLLEAESALEFFVLDGGAYPLTDSAGRSWPDMVMLEFDRPNDPYQDENGWCRDYVCTFVGLTAPDLEA